MANTNAPMGLSPVEYLNGTPWTGQARMYCIPTTDTTLDYAIGDPVVLAGSADSNGVPTITLATAGTGNVITGVIVGSAGQIYGGASVIPGQLETTVLTHSTRTKNVYVLVADDPNILFEAQEDSVAANLAATDVGTNVNLVAGTNSGYLSGWMIDSNPTATTATLQCQLMMLSQKPGNAIGQYAKWLIRINNHSYKAGTAGV